MIKGIGTDILQISRMQAALERTPKLAARILTAVELEQYHATKNAARFLAKRFAAKEAVVKALGTGIGNGVSWQHILISKDHLGKPIVNLSAAALEYSKKMAVQSVFLSYSDEQDYVVAMVVLEGA